MDIDIERRHNAWQVVKRNVATGGRVVKVGGTHFYSPDASREADRRNAAEHRGGRNVCWTTRSVYVRPSDA